MQQAVLEYCRQPTTVSYAVYRLSFCLYCGPSPTRDGTGSRSFLRGIMIGRMDGLVIYMLSSALSFLFIIYIEPPFFFKYSFLDAV